MEDDPGVYIYIIRIKRIVWQTYIVSVYKIKERLWLWYRLQFWRDTLYYDGEECGVIPSFFFSVAY